MAEHYLKYRNPEWHQDRLSPPNGRDPQRDLFTEEFRQALRSKIGWFDNAPWLALQADLRTLGESYLYAALSSPLGLNGGAPRRSYDQRLRALKSDVESPAKRLLETLSQPANATLSEFPDFLSSPPPSRQVLLRELALLLGRTSELIATLQERTGHHARKELQHDLTTAVVALFIKHFPEQEACRHKHERTGPPESEFTIFVRSCIDHVFPGDGLYAGDVLDEIAVIASWD